MIICETACVYKQDKHDCCCKLENLDNIEDYEAGMEVKCNSPCSEDDQCEFKCCCECSEVVKCSSRCNHINVTEHCLSLNAYKTCGGSKRI